MPRKFLARFLLGWLTACCLFTMVAPAARADDLPPQKYYLIDGAVTAQRLDSLESRVVKLEHQRAEAVPASAPVAPSVPFPRPDDTQFIAAAGDVTVCTDGTCRTIRSGSTQISEPKLFPNLALTTVNSSRGGLFNRLRESRATHQPLIGRLRSGGCSR